MKATGIVRRVDDLGRVVIPKEIRRTMKIREGGLGCRLGRCFYFVEVSTGHPHPSRIDTDIVSVLHIFESIINRYKATAE